MGAAQWVLVSVAAVVLLNTIFRRVRRKPPASPDDVAQTVRQLAAKLTEQHLWVDPELIESDRRFKEGVALLAAPEVPVDVPLALANEANDWTASIALLALEQRDDVPDSLTDTHSWPGFGRPPTRGRPTACAFSPGTPRGR